jgi:hypothetical protein
MQSDASVNVVVFQLEEGGRTRELIGHGPAQSPHCVRTVWLTLLEENGEARAANVRQIYSEWEPAPEDRAFLETTFPNAAFSYSFSRPAAGDWDEAIQDAEQQIRAALDDAESGSKPAKRWWEFWK